MPDMPAAEVAISAELVRSLVVSQAGDVIRDAATLPLAKVAEGWDNELWRLGDDFAVRLPRRSRSAPLVLNEQRALPGIASRLEPTGVGVPAPLVTGHPALGYPWVWSIVPWFEGDGGLGIPRSERGEWAETLAMAIGALHTPAPADHPENPVRGVPLAARAGAVADRLALLRKSSGVSAPLLDRGEDRWDAGLRAPVWPGPPLWIHGDLHPGNLVARDGRLSAIIDFGDVTAGDPAYDLAVAWLAFDAPGRERFRDALGGRYDAASWIRAEAWAAAFAVLLLVHSDDHPEYRRLGLESLEEIAGASRG